MAWVRMISGHKKPLLREKGYFESLLWGFVFFLILANVALKIVSDYWSESYDYGITRDLDMIHDFAEARKKADLGIIMLGTSRLRHALDFDFDPSVFVDLPDGRTMSVLRIGVDAGSFSSFDYMEDDILDAKPDYLFIERHLLSNDSRGGGEMTTSTFWALQAIDGYIQRVWVDGLSLEEGWTADRHGLYYDCVREFTKPLLMETLEYHKERDIHNLDGEEPRAVRAYIKQALSRGIKVVIFFFPSYQALLERNGLASYLFDVGFMDHNPTDKELLPDNYKNVTWLHYTTPKMDEELYCDPTHYNKKGRGLATDWFLKQMVELGQ